MRLTATWWGWMIAPSATQWCISLLGASSDKSLTYTEGTQFLLVWNVVALLKSALRSLKCMMFTCPKLLHWPQCLGASPCDYVLTYLPARLPLNLAPDWAKKAGFTWTTALTADDWKVGRKWLRGPDELRQMFGDRKGAGTSRWL